MVVELDKFFRCPNCQSYSLSKSKPSFYEKLRSLFLPVLVYECSNCSYRYVDKNILSIKLRFKKAMLFIVLPIVIISLLVFFSLFMGDTHIPKTVDNNKNKAKKTETVVKLKEEVKVLVKSPLVKSAKKIKSVNNAVDDSKIIKDKKEDEKTKNVAKLKTKKENEKKKEIIVVVAKKQKNKIKKVEEVKLEPAKDYSGCIVFGDSKKYGVNWKKVKEGIKIIRISVKGVFYRGGIRKNDLLIAINDIGIKTGSEINRERDNLFAGKINSIDIRVIRNNKELLFKLIKIKEMKAFERASLKLRSSHPFKKDKSFRWRFSKNSVTICRRKGQKVLISGDFSGLGNWAVDDTIIINGNNFPGIKGGSGIKGRTINEDRKFPPLDITKLVPAEKDFVLNIVLANHGILFGNTDIFIVVK